MPEGIAHRVRYEHGSRYTKRAQTSDARNELDKRLDSTNNSEPRVNEVNP